MNPILLAILSIRNTVVVVGGDSLTIDGADVLTIDGADALIL